MRCRPSVASAIRRAYQSFLTPQGCWTYFTQSRRRKATMAPKCLRNIRAHNYQMYFETVYLHNCLTKLALRRNSFCHQPHPRHSFAVLNCSYQESVYSSPILSRPSLIVLFALFIKHEFSSYAVYYAGITTLMNN